MGNPNSSENTNPLSDARLQAVKNLKLIYPHHIFYIAEAMEGLLKEKIRMSVEQIFLGSSVDELRMAKQELLAPLAVEKSHLIVDEPIDPPVPLVVAVSTPPVPTTPPVSGHKHHFGKKKKNDLLD